MSIKKNNLDNYALLIIDVINSCIENSDKLLKQFKINIKKQMWKKWILKR